MTPRTIEGIRDLRQLVGQEVGVSDWFVVTQSMIDSFAELIHDHQWIHIDRQRARTESPYGTTIAHGFLTLAMLSHLMSQIVQIRGEFTRSINYGLNRVRFPGAVLSGSRIRARATLHTVEDIPDGVQLAWVVTMECEGESKPVLVAESLGRLYR